MSLGPLLGMVVLGVVALLLGLQVAIGRMARASEGREAPALGPMGDAEGRLVWFHAPHCGPCRAMHPDVDALGDRAIVVDVTEHPELAMRYRIMATPTTMRVKHGRIAAARVGRLHRAQLDALLAL